MDKAVIGKRIREQRKEHKLTLEKFADMAGIGTVYLGEIERGEKMPSMNTFIKMVNALGISTDILLRDEVSAARPYVLNEITEKMKGLSAPQLKMVTDVFDAMIDNMSSPDVTPDELTDEE